MTNLELLKIVTFWRIVETNNVAELDINYRKSRVYTDEQLLELNQYWVKLYDEFYENRQNKSGKYLITKNFELAKMSLLLELLYDIENRIILLINMSDVKELQKFVTNRTYDVVSDFKKIYPKVRISQFDNLREILTIVQSVIKSQTNIYDEKLGVKEKTVQKQKETVYSVVATMGKILGYKLDINNMNCMEFLAHENMINASSKEVTKK